MSYLRDEILEQPEVLERLIVGQWETAVAIAQAIQRNGVEEEDLIKTFVLKL
jgi:hypothetical protein